MLVRQVPEIVSKHWDFYAPAIYRSLPPGLGNNKNAMSSVLRAILVENLVVWHYQEDDELIFILSTIIQVDPITGEKNLLIYSFTTFNHVKASQVDKAFETLRVYAMGLRCNGIIGFTQNERIVKFLSSRNIDTTYTFINKEV